MLRSTVKINNKYHDMKTCELLTAFFFTENEFRILVDLLANHNESFFVSFVIFVETIRLVMKFLKIRLFDWSTRELQDQLVPIYPLLKWEQIRLKLWSSTCPLTSFFWLLSHVIYLKLTRVL